MIVLINIKIHFENIFHLICACVCKEAHARATPPRLGAMPAHIWHNSAISEKAQERWKMFTKTCYSYVTKFPILYSLFILYLCKYVNKYYIYENYMNIFLCQFLAAFYCVSNINCSTCKILELHSGVAKFYSHWEPLKISFWSTFSYEPIHSLHGSALKSLEGEPQCHALVWRQVQYIQTIGCDMLELIQGICKRPTYRFEDTIVWERWSFWRSEINIDYRLIQCIRGFCSSSLPIFKLSLQVPWIDFYL